MRMYLVLFTLLFITCDNKDHKNMSKIVKIEEKEIPVGDNQIYKEEVMTIIGETQKIVLNKGASFKLENGVEATLNRHSHENYTSGPDSPEEVALITFIQFSFEGKSEEMIISQNSPEEDNKVFVWNGFAYQLGHYEYDKSTTLIMTKRRDPDLREL